MIWGCTLERNVADKGGGVACRGASDPLFANCIIAGNSVTGESGDGAGIFCFFSDPVIINCTITLNTANQYGGGIYCTANSNVTVTNSILWNDLPKEIYVDSGSVTATYSDIQSGWAGEGNITADPLLADPDEGDFHLTVHSPCIDTGTDAGVFDDFEGDVRPFGNGFDMGADENTKTGLLLEILEFPVSVRQGDTSVEVDMLRLDVSGPVSVKRPLWSGQGTMPPYFYAEIQLKIDVPVIAPPGFYTCTTIALFENQNLAEDAFECEVVERIR